MSSTVIRRFTAVGVLDGLAVTRPAPDGVDLPKVK